MTHRTLQIPPVQPAFKGWITTIKLISGTLLASLLLGCGGGGGANPSAVPNANNLAPSNVKLLEASSAAVGQITVSWLPATDDATSARNLTYQVHASTAPAFTASNSTKLFEGKDTYQAVVNSGLTAGATYTVRLLVVDEQGATTSSEGLRVTVSNATATLNDGVKVATLQASQVDIQNGNLITVPAASGLQVGQFIASTEGANGNGYLKKIESITTSNGNTVLQTRNASVNEVYKDVKLSSTFKLASVPQEITAASQQVGLVRTVGAVPSANNEYAWKQSGFRYSTPPSTAAANTGLPDALGQTLQVGLTKGADTDKSGSWGRLYMPSTITVAEGEVANFNIHTYIIDTSKPWVGQRRKICKIEFGAMKGIGDASKPSAVSLKAGAGTVNNQDDYRPTHIFYPTTLVAGTGSANSNPYTVDVKLRIEELDESCDEQTLWDETITLPLTIYVTNDREALRETEKVTGIFSGTAGLRITNDIELAFQPTIAFDAVVANARLDTARIQLDAAPLVEQSLRIVATAKGEVDATRTILQTRKFYKAYVTPAGVPIIISGAYRVDMIIKGDVTGAIEATEKLTIGFDKLSYGLEYKNGQYNVISNNQPVYRVSMGGKGKAQANLEITLQPRLELSAYETATGTVILEPYMDAHAGIEGHVQLDTALDFNVLQVGMAADADYRLTHGTLGGGVRVKLGAELNVFDYTIAAWPAKGELKTYDLVEHTNFWGLPLIQAVPNLQIKHPTDTRAIAVQAKATELPNPLKKLFPNLPDTFVTWSTWTNPRIVPQPLIDPASYKLLPTTGAKGEITWAVFTKPGSYTVRQGGHSSLGNWARQYVETTVEITDDNNNGIPDWWEQQYDSACGSPANAAADKDVDGLNNLQEWEAGTDPCVSNGGNVLRTSSSSVAVGQTVEVWIAEAWSNIQSAVFSFADAAASFTTKTATLVNGASQKISGFFSTVGPQTVTATFIDVLGNTVGQRSTTVTVTAAALPTATITTATSNSTTQSGTILNTGTTDDSTPTLSGTISAALTSGQKVNVYDSATLFTEVAVVSGTNWSFTPATPLTLGSHSFTAEVATFDGTPGARSAAFFIHVTNVTNPARVTSITPSTNPTVGAPVTFAVVGVNLPLTSVMSIADGACQTPTARTITGFSVVCTPGAPAGVKLLTVKTDLQANNGTVIDVTRSVTVGSTDPGGSTDKYTKIDASGNPLPANASAWSCVKDNTTGLIWEVKSPANINDAYTNYDSTNSAQVTIFGNDISTVNPTQVQINAVTNSIGFKDAINSTRLCGYSDWRIPTVTELQSIINTRSTTVPYALVDVKYFPDTRNYYYWSSKPDEFSSAKAWYVHFGNDLANASLNSNVAIRYSNFAVRLVRSCSSNGVSGQPGGEISVTDISIGGPITTIPFGGTVEVPILSGGTNISSPSDPILGIFATGGTAPCN